MEDDSVEPGAEAASTVERRESSQHFGENLLRCVLCVLRMVEHAESDVVDPSLMALDELLECPAIARASAHHEGLILAIGGCVIGQRVIDAHHRPLGFASSRPPFQGVGGKCEKWALTIFHCVPCLTKTKVVRPWIAIGLPSLVTAVNMSYAFTIPTMSLYTRQDGCRKPKLAEAMPSKASVRNLANRGLPSNR